MRVLEVLVEGARKFRVPMRPNYIITTDGSSVPVRELTDEQLFAIGMAWIKALQDEARAKRGRGAR